MVWLPMVFLFKSRVCLCDTFDPIRFFSATSQRSYGYTCTLEKQRGKHPAFHSHIKFTKENYKARNPHSFLNSVIALMRPRLTSWCILIFRATTPPMKYNASPLPIVLPRWQPSLGRLACEAVGMVPTGPRVVCLDVELRVTHFACPKEGGRW